MQLAIVLSFVCLFLNASGRHVSELPEAIPEKPLAYGYHRKEGIRKAREAFISEGVARIIGGQPVQSITQHPHQVGIIALLTTKQESVCGGSLISQTRILTAAHCWWDGDHKATKFTNVLGSTKLYSGGTRIETGPSDIIVPSKWNPDYMAYDIAIVKIKSVATNANIQVIALPATADVNRDFSGLSGIITGFGKTSDAQTGIPKTTVLYEGKVTIITNQECQRSIKDVPLQPGHLCTSGQGGKGTCEGDSGGPLTVEWSGKRIQVGIVSFGATDYCQRGDPSMYTRVTTHLTWINSNL